MSTRTRWLLCVLATSSSLVTARMAQAATPDHSLAGRVHLSAAASQRVPADVFQADLATSSSGEDLQRLTAQVAAVERRALASAQAAGVQAHTTGFSTSVRERKIGQTEQADGWTVQATWQIQSGHADKLSHALAHLGQSVQIQGLSAHVSSRLRRHVQDALLAQAIARFRAKASRITQAFGDAHYTLQDVRVQEGDASPPPRPVFFAAMALSAQEAPPQLAVQPQGDRVQVQVMGTVELHGTP